jgi:hypothetical protein
MNLWAKSLGRLAVLSVALFFFSCEDEGSIIGYKNENPKFEIKTVEIPLGSSVVTLDSLITDNKSLLSYTSLVGSYNDPLLGKVSATSYLQMFPAFTTAVPGNSEVDSAVFLVRINWYAYGLTASHKEEISLHTITGEPLNRYITHSYYSDDEIDYYSSVNLGVGSINVDAAEFKHQNALEANKQDTLRMRVRLPQELAGFLMDQALNAPPTTATTPEEYALLDSWRENFLTLFKGIALAPSPESSTVMGLNLTPEFSRIVLYYHTPDTKAHTALFVVNPATFTNFKVDRSSTELAGATAPYQEVDPASGLRYVQSANPLATKIDLTNFYAFLDTTDNILINEARITIDGVETSDAYPVHSQLYLKVLEDDNHFANSHSPEDRAVLADHFVIPGSTASTFYKSPAEGKHFIVRADNSIGSSEAPAVINYDADKSKFTGYFTFFAQKLFKYRNDTSRINYLALFPGRIWATRTVHRTVFNKDNLKLTITYTQPTQVNPE